MSEIAKKLAASNKSNSTPRTVIITQGASSTVVASSDSDSTQTYDVEALPKDAIVDTNGAGDAFAGGFLGARALGKSVGESVEVGHKLGRMNVQLSGPTFKFPKEQIV